MIKNILIILILVFGFSFSEVSHSGLTGTNIHTVYRWQFADSAARVNQSVSAADTMKLAYQRSDSTSWILVSTTGARWKKVAYASNQNTLTTSTMTLDSLKLTKGINATGGSFSGALSSTTLNTGNGANELYPMDQDQRTTASPTHVLGTYTDGVRAYNNTSSGSYIGMFKSIGMLPGFPTAYYPTIKTDNVYIYFSTEGKYSGAIGSEYFGIMDTATGSAKFTVYKDTTTMHIANVDSLKLGTGSYLKNYVEGTFPCTLKTSDVTVQQVGTITYTIIGNVVHLTFPFIYGTSNSTQLRLYCGGLTGLLDPARTVCYDVPYVTDNATSHNGTVTYVYGYGNHFVFSMKDATSFTSSGYKGVGGFLLTNKTTITYTK